MKAIWKGKIIAESDKTVVVEQNHYFPPESVNMEYLKKSGNTYQCKWKGLADYYNVAVGGETNPQFQHSDILENVRILCRWVRAALRFVF